MKKTIFCIMLLVVLSSCYEDYIHDYDYSAIYFAYQTDVRTFVVGEGMKIKVNAALAGVRENKRDREVNFAVVNSFVTQDILTEMKNSSYDYIKSSVASVNTLLPIPSDYYTISHSSKMVIESGLHFGGVTIQADSAKFLADAATRSATYAIPFNITNADADTIPDSKRTSVIGLKYENMLFGNYWHGGVTVVKDASGNEVETIRYYTNIPSPESQIMTLMTVGPHALVTNRISNVAGSFMLTLGADGTITVEKAATSGIAVSNDGACTFNRAKLLQDRKIFLNYKYENDNGTTSYATDTLTFRNRIRDGVNEWQDENPDNYK